MDDESYSVSLRNLSNDYYNGRIDFYGYRTDRKKILDKIDQEFNGGDPQEDASGDEEQPSILMQTMKFFKSKDLT